MIVVHIESGLGNQMLSYCEYLALKKQNPHQEIYLETIIYDIPECNDFICQWNGYELERIFGIQSPPNIKTLFSEKEWNNIIQEIRDTKFWLYNWNYPVIFPKILKKHGLDLKNIRGDFNPSRQIDDLRIKKPLTLKDKLRNTKLFCDVRRVYQHTFENQVITKHCKKEIMWLKTDDNIFTGQWLAMKIRGNDRELIDDEIKRTFIFPPFDNEKNRDMAKFLEGSNSVAIHARRGDMLGEIAWCYKFGYFRRAVNRIRKSVKDPVFVFFTNPDSIEWCKGNADIFGLDVEKDKIVFVDWNKGCDSYRDIQLMSYCKHAIITQSTFGWWGAYFISGKDKITISPNISIDTTDHC